LNVRKNECKMNEIKFEEDVDIISNGARKLYSLMDKKYKERTGNALEIFRRDCHKALRKWFSNVKEPINSDNSNLEHFKREIVHRIGRFVNKICEVETTGDYPIYAQMLVDRLVTNAKLQRIIKEGFNDSNVFYYKNVIKGRKDLEKVLRILEKDSLSAKVKIQFGKIRDPLLPHPEHHPYYLAILFNEKDEENIESVKKESDLKTIFREKEFGFSALRTLIEERIKDFVTYHYENGNLTSNKKVGGKKEKKE
jgi:hypothetical protein